MLYLYQGIIGLMLGVALYIFGYLADKVRSKLSKPLRYLDFLLVPIIVSFNVMNQDLISRYQITSTVAFKVILLYGVASILAYYLLNRFIQDITGGFVTKTENFSINQWIHLVVKWGLIIVVYVGILVLATWTY